MLKFFQENDNNAGLWKLRKHFFYDFSNIIQS